MAHRALGHDPDPGIRKVMYAPYALVPVSAERYLHVRSVQDPVVPNTSLPPLPFSPNLAAVIATPPSLTGGYIPVGG